MPGSNKQRKNTKFGIQQLDQWVLTVAEHLPQLSKPQATGLALWSFGMATVKTCALTTVKLFLAVLLKVKENTMRQRLREWCYGREDKRGDKRVDVDVEGCFPFLMRWIMDWWQGTQVAIALDATALSLNFTVLCVSVVYRSCAIPVAWTITKGNAKGGWNKHWFRMLGLIRPSIPSDYTVIILTDRGLYSPKLFPYIRKMGWHPFMRINANGTFCPTGCPKGERVFRPITSFAREPGESWCGTGIAFKSRRIPSTLLAYWGEEHKEAWFILTDLPPEVCDTCWYGMRAWIEQGFRTIKRGGWQWHGTRMTDPKRAERLWLAVSVATLWLLSVGGEAEAEAMTSIPEGVFPDIVDCLGQCAKPQSSAKPRRQRKAAKLRLVSVFRRGWITILVSFIRHEPLPLGRFIPEPWSVCAHERSKSLQHNRLGAAA
ncbi:MAG: transposase [Ketobacter sp.]|nr:transposase [Ketobacter sp.]